MIARKLVGFDALALYAALNAQRASRDLSWRQVAAEMWDQSISLNAERRDHPISPSTLTGIATRGDTSCQHALFMLRWLNRTPESFLSGAKATDGAPLPEAGPGRRLRWNLPRLHAALDAQRRENGLTWVQLARELRCSSSQLTSIRTARYAIGMRLAMNIVQWLGRPAADFVDAALW